MVLVSGFGDLFAGYGYHFYRPQRSWAKVMFLQASVILLTGGCLPQCMLGYTPPLEQTHPRADTPPEPGTPRTKYTTPLGSRLRHMVKERPVHILLECILVFCYAPQILVMRHRNIVVHQCMTKNGWAHYEKRVHNKKTGTRNRQSSPKPETRSIAKNRHCFP